ncbi:MAG: fused response regulator/phosphatase [Planctomycetaceae bacterium]|nr:fused response regulator/phosphatase [Planctomycetaceae bacterium]
MKILVAWDQPEQLELLELYLGLGDHEVVWTTTPDELLTQAEARTWDIVMMSITLPDVDRGFQAFKQLRRLQPDTPVVGACEPQAVFRIVQFMTNGMSAYMIRDANSDYLFMLLNVLETTVEAARAAREQEVLERLREEIDAVRKLQESMIPQCIDAPNGYEMCARYEPSQIRVVGGRAVTMAGGDYYDVFNLDDNNVVLLVGDASGHGMKAAMSIMVMHTLVRMIRTQRYQDTAAFVAEINNQLAQMTIVNEEGGFITLLYAILRLDKHEIQWTSAGHPLPLLQDLDTGEIRPMADGDPSGLPLAVMPGVDYETITTALPPHCRVLLYTDGLAEAFPEGEASAVNQFGEKGIRRTLQDSAKLSVSDTMEALFRDSNEFTQGFGRHDDTSVVLVERLKV